MAEFIYYIFKVRETFKVMLFDDQSKQISSLIAAGIVCYGALCLGSLIQKSVETNLWSLANKNFEKSEALTREVVQAVASKDAFVSSLSHEIRNPLNALNGSIDYLIEVVKDPSSLQILKNAKLSGEVLLNLVNNVLDAAKLKSEMMEISCIESNFEEILKKVLTINSESFKRNHIKVLAFIDKRLPSDLWIDPSRLLQILINIISNALKFTSKDGTISIYANWCSYHCSQEKLLAPNRGSQSINQHKEDRRLSDTHGTSLFVDRTNHFEIESLFLDEFSFEENLSRSKNFESIKTFHTKPLENLNSSRSYSEPWVINKVYSEHSLTDSTESFTERGPIRGYLKIQISDTGCGIPEENIPRLFDMFFQAHRSKTVRAEGTGLGLWICKQLCHKMGGEIKVYSQVHKGTTFVFYIPISHGRLGDSLFPILPSQHDKLNVLVADDYEYNRELHKLLLEQEGANVTLATNGKEAMEKYQAKTESYYDLIMLDVQMPVMDGFTAAKGIRNWEKEYNKRKTDIYFVSGEYFSEEEVIEDFMQKGGFESGGRVRCLKKPIDMLMVRRVLGKYKKKH